MIDRVELDVLQRVQAGVVSRRQLLAIGASDNDIERLVRRRDLTAVHPGVYVDHTGPLTRVQREWAAVLVCWPAALSHESALVRDGALKGSQPPQPIDVAVADWRRLVNRPGIRIRPTPQFEQRALLVLRPPAIAVEHAIVDVMEERLRAGDVAGGFAALAQVAWSRRTTLPMIEGALAARARVTGRATIRALIEDQRSGLCSVLERGYQQRVARPHGLPRGERQVRSTATGRATHQDLHYRPYGLIVELDGRAFHDNPSARDRDALRDLAELAVAEALTIRVTYGMAFREACRTASWIGRLLLRLGWPGPLLQCPSCPRELRQVG